MPVNRSLLRVLRSGPARSDGQLLAQYARHRDEDAFAQLVRRHAPMVLGVCRRVLGNHADADDAFQATFLVLARKAAALDGCDSLAGWLHGVAFNIARKLRHMNAQRQARERRPPPQPETPDPELLAALDEELNHLPEKYRTVIVLCDLEGLTRKEAAQRLACPEGTVAGRLARARSRLAAQLAGRGLAPVVVGGAASSLAAAVPPELIDPVLDVAALSPRVLALTEGVLKAMFVQKLRATLGVLVVCAVAFVGFSHGAATDPQPKADELPVVKGAAPKAEPSAKRLTVIQLRKLDAEKTADQIRASLTRNLGNPVTIVPVPADGVLLVYADDVTTKQIESLVKKLGEPKKVGTVIRVQNSHVAQNLALLLKRVDVTTVGIPNEGIVLVYADEDRIDELHRIARAYERDVAAVPNVGAAAKKDPQPEVTVLRLRHVSADEAAKVVGEVFNGPGRGGDRVKVVADATTNSLLVQGSPIDVETIRRLLDKAIDIPASAAKVDPKPDDLRLAELAAEVETQLDRVKFTEGMVKKGFMPASQLTVEQAKLKEFQDKLAAAKKKADDREAEKQALIEAIAAVKKLMAFAEERAKKGEKDPWALGIYQTELKNLELQLERYQKPAAKGR